MLSCSSRAMRRRSSSCNCNKRAERLRQRFFRLFAGGNVAIDFQDPDCAALCIALQHLAAPTTSRLPLASPVNRLAFPQNQRSL